MIGKNCPFCGMPLEPSGNRDKVVCPACGKEFGYNTLNAEAREELDRKRWEREKEERTGNATVRRKRSAVALPLIVTAVPLLLVLIAAITLLCTGDALSFTPGAPAIVTLIFVCFGLACAAAVWLIIVVRKKVYNGTALYVSVGVALAAALALGVVSVALGMRNYGREFDGEYVYIAGADGAELVEYRGKLTETFNVPGSIGGMTVVSVEREVFAGNAVVRSVVIEEGVKVVETDAFRGCSALETVSFPTSLKRIGRGAFADCAKLEKIVVPDGVTFIGSAAFSGCDSLEEISLPYVGETRDKGVREHFGYVFGARNYDYNADKVPASLKTVRVGGGKISSNAFNGCAGLTSLELVGVTEVGENAFSGCTGLKALTLPATVETLSEFAFVGWDSDQTISLPSAFRDVELVRCTASVIYY